MGRPKNQNPTRKVEPMLPADAYACLEKLAEMGRYGSNPTEVARYLIMREIDDLTRNGVLAIEKK
jgi:hypothetical protein